MKNIKKLLNLNRIPAFLIGFFVLLTVFAVGCPVLAQNELILGQNHSYSVVFRGNGEAIVYSKIVINNPNDTPLTDFSFEVPKVTPTELTVFQQKLSSYCAQYDYQRVATSGAQPCLKYQEPDYNSYYGYYYGGGAQAEYQKITPVQEGNLYKLTLPYPIEPFKASAVIISYAAKGYVTEFLGGYTFNFETLKVPNRITQVRVAVDVDSDLYLKGKRSQVNYGVGNAELKIAAPSSAGYSSASLDRVVGNIGNYGTLNKEAKNLAPNESFIVKGEYATSWFRLYLSSTIFGLLIIAAIVVAAFFANRFFGSNKTLSTGKNTNSEITPSPKHLPDLLFYLVMGLISVVLVVVLTAVMRFIGESGLLQGFSYGSDPILPIIIVISGLLMYALAILGPGIYVAGKKGWRGLLLVLAFEFFWFMLIIILYVALFQANTTQRSPYYGGPVPL